MDCDGDSKHREEGEQQQEEEEEQAALISRHAQRRGGGGLRYGGSACVGAVWREWLFEIRSGREETACFPELKIVRAPLLARSSLGLHSVFALLAQSLI